ncbi:smad nuclear-interacting protein 1 [Fistulifera solaris]|uniref:Smad nuclear-interacting protein 1 n=1 Tax=Fistulifera solaris TaxID=1519565 RepID=A0A1Z5JY86_FISSO|nr:smad nuclear-interacting protein 1 [Fistulifera solaris]|eukprot:GAX18721.1 smad nuclear-interacting protein 1 [Fistulifera solaris]
MTDRSKKTRWGSSAETSNNSSISDEAALQALLSSAQAHKDQRQRETEAARRRFDEKRKKRPREETSKTNGNEAKDDYYGPASRATKDDNSHSDNKNDEDAPIDKQKANFGLSGALTKDSRTGNVYKGVLLKFQEPPEARTPNTLWRFYVFKENNPDPIETLHVSKQSAFLIGRNAEIADIVVHHPSCSSQHAVLQYRALPREDGRLHCQPYLLDLESTNGTFLNGVRIDAARYYQLKKGDVLKFGASTREYVLLTANTKSVK